MQTVIIGLSVCRNENLADVFYRLQLIEETMGISASSATRLLRKMIEDGVVLREGKAKSTRYRLKG